MTDDAGFGVYVHWPYCAAICPYCDFNVRRDRGGDHEDLLRAIVADIEEHARRIARRPAQTLFLGGGTPSLLSARGVATLIEAVDAAFGLEAGAEISLEANPEHAAMFAELVSAGVNRLSLGVQALRQRDLQTLGRRHSAIEARAAIEAAAHTGARVAADFIYALDGQTEAEWADALDEILRLPIAHASFYQLTVEAGTPFARAVARGRMHALDVERAARLYELTQAKTIDAGLPAYEISNHARSESERARHNLLYWRGGDWLGVGPGAHGRTAMDGARFATRAHADPKAYVRAVTEEGVGWAERERLSGLAQGEEWLMMGLRLAEGVDRRRIECARGARFNADVLEALVAQELLYTDEHRLVLTPAGRLLADRIARDLLLA